jgi:hypothetical protein
VPSAIGILSIVIVDLVSLTIARCTGMSAANNLTRVLQNCGGSCGVEQLSVSIVSRDVFGPSHIMS